MATYTPEQFAVVLDRFAGGFPKAISRATFAAAKKLEADIKGRIFRDGGTMDIDGNTRGYRSKSWKAKRDAKGLQTSRVDLVYDGDLQRSPKLFETPKYVDLRIVGQLNVVKARGNEDRFPDKVFEASAKEEEMAREVFEIVIAEYIQKVFNQ